MKLSQFKLEQVKKKLRFVNGEIVEVEPEKKVFEGEVEFYELSLTTLNKINDNVVKHLKEEDSNELFIYKIIPFITNIENDISFNEFMDIMITPSKEFVAFMEALLIIVGELFDLLNELKKVQNTSEKVSEEMTDKIKELTSANELPKE